MTLGRQKCSRLSGGEVGCLRRRWALRKHRVPRREAGRGRGSGLHRGPGPLRNRAAALPSLPPPLGARVLWPSPRSFWVRQCCPSPLSSRRTVLFLASVLSAEASTHAVLSWCLHRPPLGSVRVDRLSLHPYSLVQGMRCPGARPGRKGAGQGHGATGPQVLQGSWLRKLSPGSEPVRVGRPPKRPLCCPWKCPAKQSKT